MPIEMDSFGGMIPEDDGGLAPCGFPGDFEELERTRMLRDYHLKAFLSQEVEEMPEGLVID